MPLNDHEFSYNGLTFGGAQIFGVTGVEGLEPPEAKSDIIEKTGAHGSFVFAEKYRHRVIVIEGDLVCPPAQVETNMTTWRNTFINRSTDLPLLHKLPGVATRRYNCRPIRRTFDFNLDYVVGYVTWMVELVAGDPTVWDEAGTTVIFVA